MSLSAPIGECKHDPDVCGLDLPGEVPLCPGCREERQHHRATQSLIRRELLRLARKWGAADRRAKRADRISDRQAAEMQRWQAAGEFHGLQSDLAHFQLTLLRITLQHEPDALQQHIKDGLRPRKAP